MSAMRVFLLRHGDAADRAPDGGLDDEARELTTAGIERLSDACATYARIVGTPDRLLHSPLQRAIQSASILAQACGFEGEMVVTDALRPGGRPSRLVDELQGWFLEGCKSVALVGHEPLLGDLLGILTSGNDRFSHPMGKGMLAAIELAEPQVMIGRLRVMLSQDAATRL